MPAPQTRVARLSRGQQALVSLACAMQHEPRVLVLDDVLSGLDVLRAQRIWDALELRARRDNTAIIISTTSIDARHADRIGLMIAGSIIAEGKPADLCFQYGRGTVEEVFRDLCLQDDRSFLPIVRKASTMTPTPKSQEFELFEAATNTDDEDDGGFDGGGRDGGGDDDAAAAEALLGRNDVYAVGEGAKNSRAIVERFRAPLHPGRQAGALLKRYTLQFSRSWIFLLLQLLLPTLQGLLFLVFVGGAPLSLPVAVSNHGGPAGDQLAVLINDTLILDTYFFDTCADAIGSVSDGQSYAAFCIPHQFTAMLDKVSTPQAHHTLFVSHCLSAAHPDGHHTAQQQRDCGVGFRLLHRYVVHDQPAQQRHGAPDDAAL